MLYFWWQLQTFYTFETEFYTFCETVIKKYKTDHKVNVDELFALFRSKDIDQYDRDKDKFFGPSGRFTTEIA